MKRIYLPIVCMWIFTQACKNEDPACGDSFEADPIGQWYHGDFHVHASGASNDTGGDSDPLSIKNKAIERGLDFVVLTDHSNSTGSDVDTTYEDPGLFNMGPEFPYWDIAAQLTDDGQFLMIDGNEISPRHPTNSVGTGHIGCIPMSTASFDTSVVFTDRPMGSVTGANALLQAQNAGCFSVINHPYSQAPWISYDWSSYDYDALEVWNGTLGFDDYDQHNYKAWICDLLQGRNTIAIGGSDNHRVNEDAPGFFTDPALGYPTTAVFSQSLEWGNIINAVKAGDVCIFEGESRLFLDGYNKDKCRDEGINTVWLRMRGAADAQLNEATVTLYHFTDCMDTRPAIDEFPELTQHILFEASLEGGKAFDFPFLIDGKSGVYAAVLSGEGVHYWALSKAIVIN